MNIPACPKIFILTEDQSAEGSVRAFRYLLKTDGIMFVGHSAVTLSGKSHEDTIISTVLSSINSTIK